MRATLTRRRAMSRRTTTVRIVVASALLLATSWVDAAQSFAPASLSAEQIIAKVVDQSRRLDPSTCSLSIHFHETSFPYLSKTISGTAYFGNDARFAAVFTNVPAVLRG